MFGVLRRIRYIRVVRRYPQHSVFASWRDEIDRYVPGFFCGKCSGTIDHQLRAYGCASELDAVQLDG